MYDSNVLLTEQNEDGDTFWEGTMGLDVRHAADRLTIECQLAAIRRVYMDLDDLDYTSFGDTLRVRYRRPGGTYLLADQRYRDVEDRHPSGDTSDLDDASSAASLTTVTQEGTRREAHNAGVAVGMDLTDKISASATYAFAMVNYARTNFYDSLEHVAVLEGGYKITDKTAAILDFEYGIEDSDAFDETTRFTAVRAGVTSRGTDKLQYKVALGGQTYQRPDDAGDDVSAVSANLTATWRATGKISIEANGRNGILASSLYRENARVVSSARLGVVYRPIATVQIQIAGTRGQEEYSDPVNVDGVMQTRKDDVLYLEGRVTYTPPAKFASVYLQVHHATLDSNVNTEDYDEWRAGGGVTVRY